ncbi:MAG: hypothetical protein IJD09_03010 [Clostridia bacterium]|nr:hypothetical protein [Clostridia bacterium]
MLRSKKTMPFWLILMVGLVCTLVMLGGRVVAEHRDRQVAVAMGYDDVVLMAQSEETTPEQWLRQVAAAGLHYLIVTDENEAHGQALADDLGLETGRSGSIAKAGDCFLMPPVDAYDVVAYEVPGGDPTVPLVLCENPWRTGVVMPRDFDPDQWEGPMVKALYMIDGYRYHYQMNEPSTENENILFRAVVERGMRLVILTPLIHEGDEALVSDPAAYIDMLQGLADRVADRGLVLGNSFSAMDAPKMNQYLFGGALLFLVAAVVALGKLLLPLPVKLEWLLLGCGTVVAYAGALLKPLLMQKAAAFGAALIFPCLGVMVLLKLAKGETLFAKIQNSGLRFFAVLALEVTIGLIGGLYVGALLSTREYLMQFSVFSGVKLSQLLPMGFAGVMLCYTLFGKKARQHHHKQKLPLPLLLVLLIAMVGALVILILRSGDNMLPVAGLEVMARNWLEYVLYARPRTKEMLLAFPALGLYLVACERRYPLLQLPLGALASVGAVSIVNTFCHIFTPLRVSLIRTVLSTLIGLVIGLAAMGIFSLILGKEKKDT